MCGRITRSSPKEAIAAELGVADASALALPPRYNLCPGEDVLVVVQRGDERRMGLVRWGLVPPDAPDARGGARLINARAESLASRPAFRRAVRERRCLVVADGFYEWRRDADARTPHLVRLRSQRPMALAGLWERWHPPDGGPSLTTCTIVTCPPNDLLATVHDRMPVVLDVEARARWLDPATTDPAALRPLLVPYPAAGLAMHEVSSLVNSPRNDSPACIEPVSR